MYAIVIGFTATFYRYLDFGLINPNNIWSEDPCSEVWWRNLLYINNFVPDDTPVVMRCYWTVPVGSW